MQMSPVLLGASMLAMINSSRVQGRRGRNQVFQTALKSDQTWPRAASSISKLAAKRSTAEKGKGYCWKGHFCWKYLSHFLNVLQKCFLWKIYLVSSGGIWFGDLNFKRWPFRSNLNYFAPEASWSDKISRHLWGKAVRSPLEMFLV